MEPIEGSETSAFKPLTPGKYPKENILHKEHGESLKSRHPDTSLYERPVTQRTAVARWLRCCATNRKVVGSISGCVSGFFIDIKSFRSHCGPGVDSASNRNEYQDYFLGVKAVGA